MIREFPARNWKKHNLCNLTKRIDDNGEIDGKRVAGDRTLRELQQTFELLAT